ncbi:hypothetical protein D3C87_269610 [compost metagenome]
MTITTHPPRVRAMLERMQLIKSDLSTVTMTISLDGNIRNLPETEELKASLSRTEATQLLTALNEAFRIQDLAKVTALYSYAVLFSDEIQEEIRKETVLEFQQFLNIGRDLAGLEQMFLHAGFGKMIQLLKDDELTTAQFKLFQAHYLHTKSNLGKRIAGIQRQLPLNSDQQNAVVTYIEQIKSENEKVEKKDNTKTTILIVVTIVLILIRLIVKMSR